jgi:hypothetical protein
MNRILMTVRKGIIQILFRQFVLIFKHVETTNIIFIGHLLAHGPLFIEFASFYRSNQVFAQSQDIESKVNGKEFIHNGQDTGFFRTIGIKRSIWLKLWR